MLLTITIESYYLTIKTDVSGSLLAAADFPARTWMSDSDCIPAIRLRLRASAVGTGPPSYLKRA